MKKARKALAVILTMVTILAMTAIPVSAQMTYYYLTTAYGTGYTTIVDNNGVGLFVQKYGTDGNGWDVAPFTNSEIGSVTWTWPYEGSENFNYYVYNMQVPGGYYAGLMVSAKQNATYGAYDVRASFNSMYIDLTLIIKPSSSLGNASVTVEVNGSKQTTESPIGFTAQNTVAASVDTNYNYATPINALNAMVGTSVGTSINYCHNNGGYIDYVTGYVTGGGTETKTENWSTGDGWQYRVYHKNGNTYVRDDSTESLSPSAYRLVNNDYVKWCYCDYNEVNSYFPTSFPVNP